MDPVLEGRRGGRGGGGGWAPVRRDSGFQQGPIICGAGRLARKVPLTVTVGKHFTMLYAVAADDLVQQRRIG